MYVKTILLLLLSISIGNANNNLNLEVFHDSFNFSGNLKQQTFNGTYPVNIRLLDTKTQKQLYQQSYSKVIFKKGKFELVIGNIKEQSLKELSSLNSHLLLELSIDNQLYGPLVNIQPAGHSSKSRLAILGLETNDDKLHEKGFNLESTKAAIQAVSFRPVDKAFPLDLIGESKTNPFLMPIRGPFISQPLSSLPVLDQIQVPFVEKEINSLRHEHLFDENGRRFGTDSINVRDDELVEKSRQLAGPLPNTPPFSESFEGINNFQGALPPDIEGAVGPYHYVQMVNTAFAIYDKSGVKLAGPTATNALWGGFGGPCQTNNSGDAIALYDQAADRYVLTQFAVNTGQSVCFAVSTSGDPLGTYYLYELPTVRFPDYYKLGVWSDTDNNAYYMGTNTGSSRQYDIYAIDRESLINGVAPRTAQFFQNFPNLLMPADQDGHMPAPKGSPGLLYTILDGGDTYFSNPPPANDSIDLYEFDVDWDTPANSSITLVNSFGPPDITDFVWTVCGFFNSNCLTQPGTGVRLDSGSWWPMQRFQYRNFGSYETLLGTWTVDALSSGNRAAPRWFELRKPTGGSWSVYQEGTHSPDSAHRWEPSISMNGNGDIGLVYNTVDAANTIRPGIRFAGRQSTDPLGVLRAESSLIEATGVQTSSSNRWGDYASMDVDPYDDCTFWFTSEYIQNTGSANWRTKIGSFRFPDCVSVISTDADQSVCSINGTADFPLEIVGEFGPNTNLSVGGCPATANCDFTVNPIPNPDTSSVLQVSSLGSVVAGDYQIAVTATGSVDPNLTFETNVALRVVSDIPVVSTLSSPTDNEQFVSTVSREFTWSAVTAVTGYLFELSTDSGFSNIIESTTVEGTTYISEIPLSAGTEYYWRVTGNNVCGAGNASATFSYTTSALPGNCLNTRVPKNAKFYNFEEGPEGWTSNSLFGSNSWNIATSNPNSGIQHWHINDVTVETDTTLTSPPITLPSASELPITLQYDNYQDLEFETNVSCWDGGILEISTDGGSSFAKINNLDLLTEPYTGPFQSNSILFGEDGWCRTPREYLESIVNLNDYAGQTVQLRFRLVTDGAAGAPGWDIEDISIQSCVSDLIYANGFESNNM